LDGVLVDFEAGAKKIFNGRSSEELPPRLLWSGINRKKDFFETLPWTPDGKKLWKELLRHSDKNGLPDILTGVPRTKASRVQKFKWCEREFGVDIPTNHLDMAGQKMSHEIVSGVKKKGVVNVITCWSKNKHYESSPRAVLIDDREEFSETWKGLFIHHVNTESTLRKLREHGVLPSKE